MLAPGSHFPQFALKATTTLNHPKEDFPTITNDSYEGKWLVVFFWPKDFTFVCPTEIAAFGKLNGEFADRDTQVLGVSTDNEFVHHAWRTHHEDLRDLPFPMLADVKRELTGALGILDAAEGVALLHADGTIQHVSVNGLDVGRNPNETLRLLDAFQTGELCPCNWKKGEEVLKPYT